jgi:CubicO group peptidase (beta-lactamase class C family)
VLLALVAAVLTTFGVAFPEPTIDAMFSAYDGTGPGATVAVIKDGQIVFERSYGLANVDTNEAISSQTNFRLASVTKQFTAMSILLLAEKKSLRLDDPVAKYLPELKATAPKVTLRHLLMHTSGLPEYDHLLPEDDKTQIVDKDVLALVTAPRKPEPSKALVNEPPPAPPGMKFRYCNTGYALLALVVERVSKQTYAEFLRRNVFDPLGMSSSMVYDPKAIIPHRAYGYRVVDDAVVPADQSRDTAVLGDGGVYSSATDLVRWIDALDRGTLVDPKLLEEATTQHIATDEAGVGYGYGWRIGDHHGTKVAFHTGTTSGFKNALLWVPSKKLAVVVLTNRRGGEPRFIASVILEMFWYR